MNCVWCEDEPGGCDLCRDSLPAVKAEPKKKKPTPAQQRKADRRSAPAARDRRFKDPGDAAHAAAVRALAGAGMLAPEELSRHRAVVTRSVPDEQARIFAKWRRDGHL